MGRDDHLLMRPGQQEEQGIDLAQLWNLISALHQTNINLRAGFAKKVDHLWALNSKLTQKCCAMYARVHKLQRINGELAAEITRLDRELESWESTR